MKRRFFVIDDENLPSWSTKTDSPESFSTFAAALKRAKECAEASPGVDILICETHTIVTATVAPASVRKVTRSRSSRRLYGK